MKNIILSLVGSFLFSSLAAQAPVISGTDYRKTLNSEEVSYFNSLFEKENFSFETKKIGFAYYDYVLFISDKYNFFNTIVPRKTETVTYQLLVLSESEKKQAGDYDAIVLSITNDRKKIKKNRPAREKIIEDIGKREFYHTYELANRYYPDYLTLLGVDSSLTLTSSESTYLNSVFQWKYRDIDFANKKIAFFSGIASDVQKTKADYFNYRKWALSNGYWQGVGTLFFLNEQQKKESGGYDFIITYSAKVYHLPRMIEQLKTKG